MFVDERWSKGFCDSFWGFNTIDRCCLRVSENAETYIMIHSSSKLLLSNNENNFMVGATTR